MSQGFPEPLTGFFADDGHTFVLTRDFTYVDCRGCSHITKAGTGIDGGSIPRFLWRLIGGPFMFAVEAYAIHDGYCNRSRQCYSPSHMRAYRLKGDTVFLEILEYLATYRKHLGKAKRLAMYKGVRLGSRQAVKARAKELNLPE